MITVLLYITIGAVALVALPGLILLAVNIVYSFIVLGVLWVLTVLEDRRQVEAKHDTDNRD